MRAVAERQLRVEGLAQRVRQRVPAHGGQRRGLAAEGLDGRDEGAEQRARRLLPGEAGVRRRVHDGDVAFEDAQVGLGEGGLVHQDEVLRRAAFRAGQALALDADHLDRHAARDGGVVVDDVAAVGGEAHHHGVAAGPGEHALGQFRGQAVEHPQLAVQQRVALRVQAADGVAVVPEGGFPDVAHQPQQRGRAFGLVRLRPLDARVVGQRRGAAAGCCWAGHPRFLCGGGGGAAGGSGCRLGGAGRRQGELAGRCRARRVRSGAACGSAPAGTRAEPRRPAGRMLAHRNLGPNVPREGRTGTGGPERRRSA